MSNYSVSADSFLVGSVCLVNKLQGNRIMCCAITSVKPTESFTETSVSYI